MRKTRKVLSFVLILALILGSFSMVFAAPASSNTATLSDIAGLLGEDAIDVCANLGIITGNPDGTFSPDKPVNRAEFAAIITRALGIPESALAGYKAANFTDTAGYGWAIGYLAFCQSKGIMIGYGDGTARPGNTITVNEAITMIMRALGYIDNSAELVGKWPSNYVTLGKAVGLYDDLADEVTMDKENAAIAIYNALVVQLVSVNTDGDTSKLWKENPNRYDEGGVPLTLANSGLGCNTDIEQILSYDAYGDTMINIANKLGAYGTAYTNKDGTLVAFAPYENTFLTGTIDGSKFEVGDKKYSFDTQTRGAIRDSVFFINGEENEDGVTTAAIDVSKILDDWADQKADGKVLTIAAKVSGTTIKDIYSVVAWNATEADMIDEGGVSGIAEDQELFGGDFVLDDDGGTDARQFALVGVKSLDDIAVDDVVYAYLNSDDEIRKVAVGQEVVEGTIDEGSSDEFVIGGTAYEYASDYLVSKEGAEFLADVDGNIGSDAIVNLDAFGYAFKVDATGGDAGLFGAITKGQTAGFDGAKIKAYTSEDATKTYAFVKATKLKITQGKSDYSWTKTSAGLDSLISGGALSAGKFIGIKLNADGDISAIQMPESGAFEIKSKTLLTTASKGYTIASNVVVMTVDSAGDYAVSSMADVDITMTKNGVVGGQYVLNEKGDKVIAILLSDDYADATSDDVFGVVNTVSNLPDDEFRLKGFVDGSAVTLDTTDAVVRGDFDLESVGLYILTKNGDGKVKEAVLFENATHTPGAVVADGKVVTAGGVSVSNRIITDNAGQKYAVDDNVVVYKAEEQSGGNYKYTASSFSASSIKAGATVYMYDTKDKKDVNENATVIIFVPAP